MSDFLNFCANDSMSSSAHHLGELVGQQSDPPIFEFNLRVFLLPTKISTSAGFGLASLRRRLASNIRRNASLTPKIGCVFIIDLALTVIGQARGTRR